MNAIDRVLSINSHSELLNVTSGLDPLSSSSVFIIAHCQVLLATCYTGILPTCWKKKGKGKN